MLLSLPLLLLLLLSYHHTASWLRARGQTLTWGWGLESLKDQLTLPPTLSHGLLLTTGTQLRGSPRPLKAEAETHLQPGRDRRRPPSSAWWWSPSCLARPFQTSAPAGGKRWGSATGKACTLAPGPCPWARKGPRWLTERTMGRVQFSALLDNSMCMWSRRRPFLLGNQSLCEQTCSQRGLSCPKSRSPICILTTADHAENPVLGLPLGSQRPRPSKCLGGKTWLYLEEFHLGTL